jgi:Sep-tRNA:Cys-tRNA synthetase
MNHGCSGGVMVEKVVEETFEALFALEDLREILRKTAPFHNLTEEQKEKVKAILSEVRKALDEIEEEIK